MKDSKELARLLIIAKRKAVIEPTNVNKSEVDRLEKEYNFAVQVEAQRPLGRRRCGG